MSEHSDFAAAVDDINEEFGARDLLRGATEFRQRWYGGRALYFLFNKNLKVTNVQFTELLSLLRLHTHEPRKKTPAKALHFVTSEEFDQLFVEVTEPFAGKPRIGRTLATLYLEVFARTVIVDPCYGSCNVFIPPTLTTDMAAIAGEAAYLHSCGYSVFVRNMVKAEPTLLQEKLTEHLKQFPPRDGKRLRFLIYADEDFTARDRDDAGLLKDGLDDAKIHVEKAWFRTERLVDVVNRLKKDMKDKLVFTDSRVDIVDRKRHTEDDGIDLTRTLWLVQDRAVGSPCERPGEDRYYICYDQLYRSRNAIHIFDENKPAWQDHTTMPPSLAGSLLNIVRKPRKSTRQLDVADPFVGTGTSLLEALRFPDMSFQGFDIDESSGILVEDNLEFFWRNKGEIKDIHQRFVKVKGDLQEAKRRKHGRKLENTDVFRIAKKLFASGSLAREARDHEKLSLHGDRLPSKQPDRLLAYVALRASKRNSARFARATVPENEDWFQVFEQELEDLTKQIGALVELRELNDLDKSLEAHIFAAHEHAGRGSASIVLLEDAYSVACIPQAQTEKSRKAKATERYSLHVGRDEGDALELTPGAFDIVIGDPPYGFNASKNSDQLAKFYRGFAKTGLRALRDGGHLLLCLPERSHSGRYSPAFTHRGLVVQQLLLVAGEVERQLIFPHDRVRGAEDLYESEYYWESARALRRSVLHVQVRHTASSEL
jgi:hypothetical protein